jgi:endoglucanase
MLLFALLCVTAFAATTSTSSTKLKYTGLAFGNGWDADQVAHYVGRKGVNTVKIPFKWEQLQKYRNWPVSQLALQQLARRVDYVTMDLNATAVLDLHNAGRYRGGVIGAKGGPTNEQFAYLWKEVAETFKHNKKVIFGLGHEPGYKHNSTMWAETLTEAVHAIRGAGATQTIAIQGTRFSTVWNWNVADKYESNAVAMSRVHDPLNKTIFEMHQSMSLYNWVGHGELAAALLMNNNTACPDAETAVSYFNHTTARLQSQGQKAILGQVGSIDNSTCLDTLDAVLSYMEQHSDVWTGFVYWATGRFWDDDDASHHPIQFTSVVEKHLQSH